MRRCTYPLTAVGAVKRVYTNLAVLDVTDDGFVVRDMAPGLTFEALQDVTDAPLTHGELTRITVFHVLPASVTGRRVRSKRKSRHLRVQSRRAP